MNNTIIIGNATTTNRICFRKDFEKYLTDSNRGPIEESILAFIDLHPSLAIQNLFKMACQPKENIPEKLWQKLNLDPSIISDEMWKSFVNELRFQYKRVHIEFMTEFDIPSECSAAYNALSGTTSEVTTYVFYKNAHYFLLNNSREHISRTLAWLDWHSKDPEVVKEKHIKALKRLSLTVYAAEYFEPHCEKALALLEAMDAHIRNQTEGDLPFVVKFLPSEVEPSAQDVASEAPASDNVPIEEPASKNSPENAFNPELSLENIQKYENEFRELVFNDSATALRTLINVGFKMTDLYDKSSDISLVLQALDAVATAEAELNKAVEALSK